MKTYNQLWIRQWIAHAKEAAAVAPRKEGCESPSGVVMLRDGGPDENIEMLFWTHGGLFERQEGSPFPNLWLHAEAKAVLRAALRGVRLYGASCVTSGAPCLDCFQQLAMVGVVRIYHGEPIDLSIREEAKRLGIDLVQFDEVDAEPDVVSELRDENRRLTERVAQLERSAFAARHK